MEKKLRYCEIQMHKEGASTYSLWNWEIDDGAIDPAKFDESLKAAKKHLDNIGAKYEVTIKEVSESKTTFIKVARIEIKEDK